MITFGLKFTGEIPFKEVYITGLLYDKYGKKMSKTKGNVIDPIDLIDEIDLETLVKKRVSSLMLQSVAEKIEKNTRSEFPHGIQVYGTDALRFSFVQAATLGNNINFNIQNVEKARNFCNKIWNATKYVLHRMEMYHITQVNNEAAIDYGQLCIADRWILSRLQRLISSSHLNHQTYRFDMLAHSVLEFIWHDFCDWYLECSKPILDHSREESRLLHPVIPFLTEGLWQTIKPFKQIERNSIMLESYPQYFEYLIDIEAENEMEWMRNIIEAIRSIRGENKVPHGKSISVILKKGTEEDIVLAGKHSLLLKTLSKVSQIEWAEEQRLLSPMMVSIVGSLKIYILMADLVDIKAEIIRLKKEIKRYEEMIDKIRVKVEDPKFLAKAPSHLIDQESASLKEYEGVWEKMKEQLGKFNSHEIKAEKNIAEIKEGIQHLPLRCK